MTVERISRTATWREQFIAKHGARCHYCNRAGTLFEGPGQRPWHIDHMEPLARGGADDESNLTLACKRCNLTKNAWPYKQFVDLARAAFWQPDDGISEGELDALLSAWNFLSRHHTAIRVDRGEALEPSRLVGFNPSDPSAEAPLVVTEFSDGEGVAVLDFIVAAHRLIPHLIAEVRERRSDAEHGERGVA